MVGRGLIAEQGVVAGAFVEERDVVDDRGGSVGPLAERRRCTSTLFKLLQKASIAGGRYHLGSSRQRDVGLLERGRIFAHRRGQHTETLCARGHLDRLPAGQPHTYGFALERRVIPPERYRVFLHLCLR